MNHVKAFIVTSSLLFAADLAIANEPPALDHNPFARPPSQEIRTPGPAVSSDAGSRWSLPLLATLVGPSQRYADVGGRILKPGDELEGYLLIDVQEDRARFAKDGREFTVTVRVDETDDDDE